MLAHNKEGKLCIEDADGSVELDFSKLVSSNSRPRILLVNAVLQDEPGDGLFTDGCFALVEGEYTEEATLEIIAIGQPPCEPREIARSIYGHIDFLGKGSTSLLEDVRRISSLFVRSLRIHSHNLQHASVKSSPNFTFSSSRMSGSTIPRRFPVSGKCLIIAPKTTSFQRSSSCVAILQVNLSRMETGGRCNDIKVRYALCFQDGIGFH